MTIYYDPNYENVLLLLSMEGNNGAQTFTDYSPTPLTAHNLANQGPVNSNSVTLFYPTSAYFDGSDALIVDYAARLNNLTGDFTWEMWLYPLSTAEQCLWHRGGGANGTSGPLAVKQLATTSYVDMYLYNGTTTLHLTSSTGLTASTWNYLAIKRYGTAVTSHMGVAGGGTTTQVASGTLSGALQSNTEPVVIGNNGNYNDKRYYGYMGEIRLSTVARDVSAVPIEPFGKAAPPPPPVPPIINASMQACQTAGFAYSAGI
jgi:hypothetical protein